MNLGLNHSNCLHFGCLVLGQLDLDCFGQHQNPDSEHPNKPQHKHQIFVALIDQLDLLELDLLDQHLNFDLNCLKKLQYMHQVAVVPIGQPNLDCFDLLENYHFG